MRLDELLDEYEDRRDRGQAVAPEDLCRDCPELLPELKKKITALESLERRLGGNAVPEDAQAGRYRAIELFARGGLGEVFRAFDEELKREVALKRIQPWLDRDADRRARFVREAEITGRLEHPGIVPVYGLGRDAHGRPYYAMRLVHGETMDGAIGKLRESSEPRVALQSLVRRFLSVCQTIAYAHSKGVVHRDLKPSNILLGPFGETLVVDWGLAKPVGEGEGSGGTPPEPPPIGTPELTLPGERKGSPAYMSPEQARGDIPSIGPASDVFGLGATLFKILSGHAPYGGPDGIERSKRGEVPPLPHGAPKPLAAICGKAMQARPEERYAGAVEMANDVERWLAGEPVSAWREPWDLRLRRQMRRHRALVTAGAAALAVAAVSLAVLAAQQRASNLDLSAANVRVRDALGQAETERDRAEETAYRIALAGAERELLAGRPAAAEELLDACAPMPGRPDLRGIEWDLLKRRARPEAIRIRIDGTPRLLEFAGRETLILEPGRRIRLDGPAADPTPPGTSLEAMTADGSVSVERPLGGNVILVHRPEGDVRLEGSEQFLLALALSPDGRRVVSVDLDGVLHVWDVREGRETGRLPAPAGSGGSAFDRWQAHHGLVAFSPDGRSVALLVCWQKGGDAFDRRLSIVDLNGVRERFAVERVEEGRGPRIEETVTGPRALVFSPDGSRIAFPAYDHTVRIHDAATGEPLRVLFGHDGAVRAIAFLPDGARLASAGVDRAVRLWDLADGSSVLLGAHDGTVEALAASPDGSRVASASEGVIKVWEPVPGRLWRGLHGRAVTDLDVSRGGALATGGADGKARIRDGVTAKLRMESEERGSVLVRFHPEAERLAVGSWKGLALLDLATGARKDLVEMESFERIVAVAMSPDGLHVACAIAKYVGGNGIRVVDTGTGKELWQGFVADVSRLLFPPDGRTLLCASKELLGQARLDGFDLATGKLLWSRDGVTDVAFRADGKQSAWLSDALELRADGNAPGVGLEAPSGGAVRLLYSPDGSRLVVVANDPGSREKGILAFYETLHGRKLVEVHGDGAELTAAAFAPDGNTLFTGDATGAVHVWDLRKAR